MTDVVEVPVDEVVADIPPVEPVADAPTGEADEVPVEVPADKVAADTPPVEPVADAPKEEAQLGGLPVSVWTKTMSRFFDARDLSFLHSTCKGLGEIANNQSLWMEAFADSWKSTKADLEAAQIADWKKEYITAWDFRPGTIGNTPYPDMLQGNEKVALEFGDYVKLTAAGEEVEPKEAEDESDKESQDKEMVLMDSLKMLPWGEPVKKKIGYYLLAGKPQFYPGTEISPSTIPPYIGTVQSRAPVEPLPYGRCNVGYFEITVNAVAEVAGSAIGLAQRGITNTVPGWFNNSWGLVSDGSFYYNSPSNKIALLEKWKEGDVVGMGINFETKSIFVMHNEKLIVPPPEAAAIPDSVLYSCYAAFVFWGKGAIGTNFGLAPFKHFKLLEYQTAHTTKFLSIQGSFEHFTETLTALVTAVVPTATEKAIKTLRQTFYRTRNAAVLPPEARTELAGVLTKLLGKLLPPGHAPTPEALAIPDKIAMYSEATALMLLSYYQRDIIDTLEIWKLFPRVQQKSELDIQNTLKCVALIADDKVGHDNDILKIHMARLLENLKISIPKEKKETMAQYNTKVRTELLNSLVGQIYETLESFRTSKRRIETQRQANMKVVSMGPNLVHPRFGADVLAGHFAVLCDQTFPSHHPVVLESLLRCYLLAGYDNRMDNLNEMNLNDFSIARKQALQYLATEMKVIKAWLLANPGEREIYFLKMAAMLGYLLPSANKDLADSVYKESVLLNKYVKSVPSRAPYLREAMGRVWVAVLDAKRTDLAVIQRTDVLDDPFSIDMLKRLSTRFGAVAKLAKGKPAKAAASDGEDDLPGLEKDFGEDKRYGKLKDLDEESDEEEEKPVRRGKPRQAAPPARQRPKPAATKPGRGKKAVESESESEESEESDSDESEEEKPRRGSRAQVKAKAKAKAKAKKSKKSKKESSMGTIVGVGLAVVAGLAAVSVAAVFALGGSGNRPRKGVPKY